MSHRISLILLAMCLSLWLNAAMTCNTTISSFPYFENFSANFGNFENVGGDDFDWARNASTTPSAGTGPTSAFNGSWYLYTEASAPNHPGKTAILHSPCFDLTGLSVPYFTFRYHMYANGTGMGTLSVEASVDGVNWYQQFSKSGNQGNQWNLGVVDLSGFSNATVKLRFKVTTGSTFRGDIALDDFQIFPIQNCLATISNFPYSESFESGLGNCRNDYLDDFDWTRLSGSTPSSVTGPSTASDGNYYMYTEASHPNNPNKLALFNTPCFDLRDYPSAEFSFDYHMFGSGMGDLELQLSSDGVNWTTIWAENGNQSDAWHSKTIDLNPYGGQVFMLRFWGKVATNYLSDIAIDNLKLKTCTLVQIDITFDTYPEETSWAIYDDNGSAVASGGPYSSEQDNSTLRIVECLEDGCYEFVISDVFGDGICCYFGNGNWDISYEGTSHNSPSSGAFGTSESHEFCIGGTGKTLAPNTRQIQTPEGNELLIYPNPARESLTLRYKATIAESATLQIFNALGQLVERKDIALSKGLNEVQVGLDLLSSGQYYVVLRTTNEVLGKKLTVAK